MGNIATEYGQNHEPLALLGYINKTGNALMKSALFTQCMTGLAQTLTESLMRDCLRLNARLAYATSYCPI